MAVDFITINLSAQQASLLKQYTVALRSAYDIGNRLIGMMGHMNDGTTFTQIETSFGVPTGQGQVVFNLVNGSFGSMNGTFQVADAKTITEKVG
jgi:hypothetical protein